MNKLFTSLSLLFLSATQVPVFAQVPQLRKHFVYFTDKANTPYSLSNPLEFLSQKALDRRSRQKINLNSRDLPVDPAYVAGIENLGVDVVYKSKWFNGAVVLCDSAKLRKVLNLPYVKDQNLPLNREKPGFARGDKFEKEISLSNQRTSASRSDYGKSFRQAEMIGATAMHDAGFRGEGMTIAVFDAGFPGVNTAVPFAHLYLNNQIKNVYDFVGNDKDVYERSNHGTQTLSCIGAFQPGKFIGTAYKADFHLYITEDDRTEHHIEEINWLLAAELADSAGVDVISSSLGYTTFDYPSFSYTQSQLDGNTTISTKAADFAASTGILVINSAGNEGSSGWRSLGAPSDGDSVLAVAAVDSAGRRASFSSFGYINGQKVKPNLSAQGLFSAVVFPSGEVGLNNGTSFSCPILAGMATGFWQAHPNLTNMEVIHYLQRSGTLACDPNDGLGYGLPDFTRARDLVSQSLGANDKVILYPNPNKIQQLNFKFSDQAISGFGNVFIYDRLGRSVDEGVVEKNMCQSVVTFKPTAALNVGMYFVRMTFGNQTQSYRLVISQ